jgi:hypothetical protein
MERTNYAAHADVRDAPRALPEDDLRILRTARPNTLLLGPAWATEAAVEQLIADRGERVCFWTPAQSIRPFERTTVVIRDVGVLALHVQAAWVAALDRAPRERPPQIISTNSFSVFPLIARHVFLDVLYYRLNYVLVDLRRGGTA